MITPAACPTCGSPHVLVLTCRGGPHRERWVCAGCTKVLARIPRHWTEPVIRNDREHMWPSRHVK